MKIPILRVFIVSLGSLLNGLYLLADETTPTKDISINTQNVSISLKRYNPPHWLSNDAFIVPLNYQPDWLKAYNAECGYGVSNFEEWKDYVTEDVVKALGVSEANFNEIILGSSTNNISRKSTLFYEINFKTHDKQFKVLGLSPKEGWFTNFVNIGTATLLIKEKDRWRGHFLGAESWLFNGVETWVLKFPITEYEKMKKLMEVPELTTNHLGQIIPLEN